MHVDFGVGDETAHKDVGFLDFHKICAIGPADSFFLNLVSEPVVFFLEGQVSDLFRSEGEELFVIDFHDGLFFPFEFGFFWVLGDLR